MSLFRRKTPAKSGPGAARSETANADTPGAGAGRQHARRISLALQGGGSHGAFEWGVLDRLLEEELIEIAAVSAVSAGAMNAAALAAGLARAGRAGARAALDAFWRAVNQAGGRNVFGDSAVWTAAFNPQWMQSNPFYRYFEGLLLSSSPYDFNPFNLNPLAEGAEADG